jgi:uncharacterized membrane protein YGL010W
MRPIQLDATWSSLMQQYRDDHTHPVNQACHTVGVPLIAGSLPVAATLVGLPLAAAMFTVGWTFQLVGHAFEGKKPSFVEDRRQLVVGLLWWLAKTNLVPIRETRSGETDARA